MNNKKIVSVLTALLIVTMAVPVFADNHMEDKVKVTGEVKSVFQVGNYSDNSQAAAELWADDDALDENYQDDPDLFPAEKAFYQEMSFNVAAMVNENINFDLALDTITNNFAATAGDYGDPIPNPNTDAEKNLSMDTATLTIADDVSTLKIGDVAGFHADYTFIDDEDRQGMTLNTVAMNSDVSAFVLSDDSDAPAGPADFYGVTASRDLANSTVTGKILHANDFDVDDNGTLVNVTNVVAAIDTNVNENVTANGKLVFNDGEDDSDTFMSAGVSAAMNEALTVNAKTEMMGEDFAQVQGDTEGPGTDLFEVSADYVLDDANTVTGAYTMITKDGEDEDKNTIEVALENVNGAYTNNASIATTANDGYDDDTDVTVIKVGTEYAMDDATLMAELTNQSADSNNEFTYIKLGYDQQITENITWNTSLGYIDGTTASDSNNLIDSGVATGADADSTDLETSLTVKF
ncbi:hypothetical protein [Halanaerobacter jeridensis]|uniref:Uncharacterized protein n=1 Tax=Halanaerobacter jeridensis TaxID=706427 RepID=A0A939BMM6_9FIRM|nr:hypothetical protein [Halanaerobacter jeridensis]MBM7556955.1 hypothetical protein [Halanaerobacter jeridensis]